MLSTCPQVHFLVCPDSVHGKFQGLTYVSSYKEKTKFTFLVQV